MSINLENHPCFSSNACSDHARIHLPVAPKCNVQCGFCNRKYDCVNESRPGVCSSVLSPRQALYYLEKAMEKRFFDVVGIAGPGDPFANPDETMETLSLVHAAYPEVMLCVATNGLNLRPYIPELARLGVTHVTITVNGVDPETAGRAYRWIRHNKKVYRGKAAGEIIMNEQLQAVRELRDQGILVKINSIIIPGVNDHHIPEIARITGGLGATTQNCLPLLPVKGTDFGHLPHPAHEQVQDIRKKSGEFIPQMGHCRRCRADAAGLLEEAMSEGITSLLKEAASRPLSPAEDRPCVAVASYEGMLVNQHLGHAEKLRIYRKDETGYHIESERIMPVPGRGDERWITIAERLSDCSALLTSGIGKRPEEILSGSGVKIIQVEGLIDEALRGVFEGKDLKHMAVRKGACSGNAAGCA
ncbi:MAG: radical SAM protein [Spirochaetales bacterium]|nr:radical SAM protein [Spirochaetales bacterium]